MRTFFFFAAMTSLLCTSARSRADEGSEASHWYGYETLATDGVAAALLIPAFAIHTPTQQGFGVASLAVFGVGAPVAHFARGHVAKGFADLALRLSVPVLTTFAGAAIGSATVPPCPSSAKDTILGCSFWGFDQVATGALIGAAVGTLSVSAFDAIVLAREPLHLADAGEHAARGAEVPPLRIEPAFAVAPERHHGGLATLGFVGEF